MDKITGGGISSEINNDFETRQKHNIQLCKDFDHLGNFFFLIIKFHKLTIVKL